MLYCSVAELHVPQACSAWRSPKDDGMQYKSPEKRVPNGMSVERENSATNTVRNTLRKCAKSLFGALAKQTKCPLGGRAHDTRMRRVSRNNMSFSPLARVAVLLALAGTKIRKRTGVQPGLMLAGALWASAGSRASGMRVAT